MKNLSLFVSAFALLSSSAYADPINCGSRPSCPDLGYVDVVTTCPTNTNGSKMYLVCPFDEKMGICIPEAAIGQIGYFATKPAETSGWLLCDGKSYSATEYPQLSARLGTIFGGTKGSTFNVPDYRGFFLRVYAQGTTSSYVRSNFSDYAKGAVNSSFTTPQKEGLPNITGSFAVDDQTIKLEYKPSRYSTDKITLPMGAFKGYAKLGTGYDAKSSLWNIPDDQLGNLNNIETGFKLNFNATDSNPVYGAQTGVTPPNMAVYAYIYAGKRVK